MGCDPEIFLMNPTGKIIPSCGLIGGTKKEPKDIGKGVKVQEDNVTLEFNCDPVEHEMDSGLFVNSALNAFRHVNNYISKLGYIYSQESSVKFSDADLKHPQANVFGCDPDFNAHLQGAPNPPINTDNFKGWRSAGGHIHFGYDVEKVEIPPWALVQLIEALVLFPYADLQTFAMIGQQRSQMYGKAGAYRPKPYGLEYRTPSNYWLFAGASVVTHMGNVVLWAINNQDKARNLYDMINFSAVEREINTATPTGKHSPFLRELYSRFVDRNFTPEPDARIGLAAAAVPRPRGVQGGRVNPIRIEAPAGMFQDVMQWAPNAALEQAAVQAQRNAFDVWINEPPAEPRREG